LYAFVNGILRGSSSLRILENLHMK